MANGNEQEVLQILEDSFLGEILKDEGITDIRFDGTKLTLQHNQKGYIRADFTPSREEIKRLVRRIADTQNKEFTHSQPILETEIGYLRVCAVHEAASPDGISLAIRVSRPRLALSSIKEMTSKKNEDIEKLLKVLVQAGNNIVISGKTGAGKTELQKLLVGYIPDDQPIVLIEDTRDSHIKALYPEKDIMSWQTLLSEDRDKKITIQDLVKTSLRTNPIWTIVSETRGAEAADMLDSAKTDHSIITTIHAKGAMNIPSRFIPIIRQSPSYSDMSEMLIGREVTELLRFGIHLGVEMEQGKVVRRIKEIVEFTGFGESGAEGVYLYKENREYDEEKNVYYIKEIMNPLTEKTITDLKNKKLYHLLPDIFKGKR